MPEKIGKYEVLERIGRGGMGMIFKAHDPVLDRPVALKVISTEVEVTDELRARFFREAQACAKLSHPNIVTIHDMGEDDGRLFIVMELLEGEELKRIIVERRVLALEDKLAMMMQVCDGLDYAHKKGVVHRDVKPGNIFLLRNGKVKILDFGIAHIATTEGLTRTGLIMGTLRYISPEQVRGRADRRSDIFSVGAVFYEVLSFRPPFTGADPMHLLEQLRTEEPPSLTELDPNIPAELAAIVQRAMRKDPAERYQDLEQMRGELEVIHRGLSEEAQRIRTRARSERDQLIQLEAALVERIGAPGKEEATPPIDERGGVVTMHALERDLASRIEALRDKIARTDALVPAFQRATELLRAGHFTDAALEFEAIVADMPEHARAQEGLRQARAQAEEQRRRQLAAELLRDARAAFDEGGYALCLEILKQAADISPPAPIDQEITSLHQTAEAALHAQEAARRGRELAEQARDQMAQARRDAQGQDASHYAHGVWGEAEVKAAEAQAHLVQEAYGEAGQAFEQAAIAYRQAQDEAREARIREREAAERARAQMAQSHQQAQAADAGQYARETWDAAEAKSTEAGAAFGRRSLAHAIRLFDEATALYSRAAEAAREARQRERQRAEEARGRAVQSQQSASAAGAERHATPSWNQASAKLTEAEAAVLREQFANAAQAFESAVGLYRQAGAEAVEARRRQRAKAEQARQSMTEARGSALSVDAVSHAPGSWNEAESGAAAAEAAFAKEAYAEAGQSFELAADHYRKAEKPAREAARRREAERADAEKALEAAAQARRLADQAHASQYVAEQWTGSEAAEARAIAALGRQEYAAARTLFGEARRLYAAAAEAAGVAAEAMARRADALTGTARRSLEAGDPATCLRRLDEVLALRPGDEAAVALRRQAEEKLRQLETASRRMTDTAPRGEAPTVSARAPGQTGPMPAARAEAPTGLTKAPGVRVEPTESGERTELIEQPTVLADRPAPSSGVPAVEPGRESLDVTAAGEGTVPEEATVIADPTVVSRPEIGDIVPKRPPTIAHTDGARTTADQPRRPGARAAVIAVGALAAIAIGIVYWRPQPPAVSTPARQAAPAAPPVTPPVARPAEPSAGRDAAEELRKRQAAAREEAARREALARKEGEALAFESQAVDARRTAELVDAPRLARALWAKGAEAERKAGDAVKEQAFDQAQALFGDAQKAYHEAARAAAASAKALTDEQARVATKKARDDAEQTAAIQAAAERRVVADRAAAAEQARVAALQRQRSEADQARADQARSEMAGARRAAEQAGAARHASNKQLLASVEAKERDGQAAFGRSDFGTAERFFREAQTGYQSAAQEARREAEAEATRVAALKAGLEQSRERAGTRREQAVKTEATHLAKDLFDAARAKQVEADGLAGRQNFAAANLAYQDAAERYLEAALRAQGVREARAHADSAKTRMLAEKQKAKPDSADFKLGLVEEQRGIALYEQLAYKEAAERFQRAEMLFTKTATPVAPPKRRQTPAGPG